VTKNSPIFIEFSLQRTSTPVYLRRRQIVSKTVRPFWILDYGQNLESIYYLLMVIQPCHNSSGQSPASHHEGPDSIPSSPCVIYGGQSGTRIGQSPSASAFPFQYYLTNVPQLFIQLLQPAE